jgi:hypothetical protein
MSVRSGTCRMADNLASALICLTPIEFPHLLKAIDPGVYLQGQENSRFNPTFHLYSLVAFCKKIYVTRCTTKTHLTPKLETVIVQAQSIDQSPFQ